MFCTITHLYMLGEVYSATDNSSSTTKVAIKIDKKDGHPALMKWEAEVLGDLQS